MHVLIENGTVKKYPYSLRELQQANPNTSFPSNNDAAYEGFGMFRVFNSTPPAYDEATHKLVEGTPVFDQDASRWAQVWQAVALSADELAEREASGKSANKAQAEQLLLETDWADLASVRNTAFTPHLANGAEFDVYRLALRAIVVDPPVTVDPWPARPAAVWSE